MHNRTLIGDCRASMLELIEQGVKVQTCVTSPPYWGLRDYGTASWEGGDAGCDHRSPTMREGRNEDRAKLAGSEATNAAQLRLAHRTGCGKCGAVKVDQQLGLESTPDEYVANMVEVFRLARDLLADDGTLWLNLGDSYAANAATAKGRVGFESNRGSDTPTLNGEHQGRNAFRGSGIKSKDLIGIPWRVAFALQADGWYLRQDIIWAKPNPMPESVTDRCTKAHEYLFLLSKRERYYFDAAAIAEKSNGAHAHGANATKVPNRNDQESDLARVWGSDSRNRRSVWTVATQPYSEAHFATFPRALIEPCIMAGTSERGHCPQCGKRCERVVERSRSFESGSGRSGNPINGKNGPSLQGAGYGDIRMGPSISTETIGWKPSCACGVDMVPDVVFDPFIGSGTTGQVAQDLGRQWLGCELNPDYEQLAKRRTAQQGIIFA